MVARGRPKKHPNGTKVVSARLPVEDVDWLYQIAPYYDGGAPGVLQDAITLFRETMDPAAVETARAALVAERIELKERYQAEDIQLEREIARCDEKKAALEHSERIARAAGVDLLIKVATSDPGINWRNWFEARKDVLAQYGKASVDEAMEYITNPPREDVIEVLSRVTPNRKCLEAWR